MKSKLENKAKFFCLYHGQNVMKTATPSGYSALMKVDYIASKNQAYFLELTPLSQISDEDAKMCVQVRSSTHIDVEITSRSNSGFGFTSRYNTSKRRRLHGYSLGFGEKMTIEQIDYLRSKGYALPWLGISVEEQIKRGWVKLKTN